MAEIGVVIDATDRTGRGVRSAQRNLRGLRRSIRQVETGAERAGRGVRSIARGISRGFGAARQALTAIVKRIGLVVAAATAAGAAIIGIGNSVAQSILPIGNLAAKLNLTTEEAAALDAVARNVGVDVQQLADGVQTLAERLGLAVLGEESAQEAFDRLGVSWQELQRLSPLDAYLAVNDALARQRDASIRSAVGNELLGGSYNELNNILGDLRRNLEEELDNPLILDDQDVANAADFNREWQDFRDLLRSLKANILPVATALLGLLNDVLEPIAEFFDDLDFEAFRDLGQLASDLRDEFQETFGFDIVDPFAALVGAWETTRDTLTDEWDRWQTDVPRAFGVIGDGLVAAWETSIGGLETGWNTTRDALEDEWDRWSTDVPRAFGVIGRGIGAAWDLTMGGLRTGWTATRDLLTGGWASFRSTAGAAWDLIGGGIFASWAATWDVFESAWTSTRDFFTSGWAAFRSTAGAAWDLIGGGIFASWQTTMDAFETAWTAVRNFLKTSWTGFRDLILGIVREIREAIESIPSPGDIGDFLNPSTAVPGGTVPTVTSGGGPSHVTNNVNVYPQALISTEHDLEAFIVRTINQHLTVRSGLLTT